MKITYTAFAVLILSILFPDWAFGQQNYQPAKIITLTGDTLRGFINYQGWDKNPNLIAFKPDQQAPSRIFRPLDIKGFRVNNEQYTSAQVIIEDSPQGLGELTTSATPQYRTDTTFLKALITGPRSLHRYKTGGREYFYTEQEGKFSLLVYKRYRQAGSSTVVMQANDLYRKQLALYLAACPTIEKRLQLLRYASSSLQKLFAVYYACTNQKTTFLLKTKTVYHVGVLGGPSRATLSFDPSPHPLAPALDNYTAYGASGGVFFYFLLPGNLGHWSINNELTCNTLALKGTNESFSSTTNSYSKTTLSLAFSYLKLNTLLRFTRPVGSIGAVFANAGISNGYALQAKTEKTVTTKFYSSESTSTGEAFPEPRRYEQGLVAGIGGSVKKLSAEVRYERSNGFLDITSLGSSFARYSLLFGYRLY
jgi:hypothetical protein